MSKVPEQDPTVRDTALAEIDAWLDEALPSEATETVAARVRQDPELASEERRLRSLMALLEESRIEVGADFADSVMRRLPRRSSSLSWWLAAAAVVVLAALAGWMANAAGTDWSVLEDLAAVGAFLSSTAVAGAGLLGASWSALRSDIVNWLLASPVNLGVAICALLATSSLLVALLRRRSAAHEPARRREPKED